MKLWTLEIPTRKYFGLTKYPRKNFLDTWRHMKARPTRPTMAQDPRNLVHSIRRLFQNQVYPRHLIDYFYRHLILSHVTPFPYWRQIDKWNSLEGSRALHAIGKAIAIQHNGGKENNAFNKHWFATNVDRNHVDRKSTSL